VGNVGGGRLEAVWGKVEVKGVVERRMEKRD